MVLLNLILEFLTVVSFIFFFLMFYDAYKWESNKFKRFDKMLHNDILGYMSDKLDIKIFLLEAKCEDDLVNDVREIILGYEKPWKKIKYNETSLKNELYFDAVWYHLRFEDYVNYSVPVFRFKERNYFAKKKYKILNPKKGIIHNYEILGDKTTSRKLFSKGGYPYMNINAKYQIIKIHSFEKYHRGHDSTMEFEVFPYINDDLIGPKVFEFCYEDGIHYLVASLKGAKPYGMQEPEQIRSVNYFLHPTAGKIELGQDVEVKRKPKNFFGRIPTDYEKYPQFKPKLVTAYDLTKELLKDYLDCPEKATGLYKRLVDHYFKYIKPLEDEKALMKALEEKERQT